MGLSGHSALRTAPIAPRRRALASAAARASACAAALALGACASPAPTPGPPVAEEASRRFYEAWRLERRAADQLGTELTLAGLPASEEEAGPRSGVTGTGGGGTEEARAAAELEPEWVAPQRLLDDALRLDLRGPEALARRRAALAARPDDPAAHYLVGRLGGTDAEQAFERAVAIAPEFGWGWHGLAWSAHRRGATERALPLGARALALARDPHEVVHFAHALTRYLVAEERHEEAARLLDDLLRRAGDGSGAGPGATLRPEEQLFLSVEQALGELSTPLPVVHDADTASEARLTVRGPATMRRRGARRALELLATPGTTAAERFALVSALVERGAVSSDEVLLALAGAVVHSREDRTAALRGEVLGMRGDSILGMALRAGSGARTSRERVADDFRVGEPLESFRAWLAELPDRLKDAEGAPLHAPLRALATALEDASPLAGADFGARAALADALLDAGWFDEAESLALRGLVMGQHAGDVLRRALAARTSFAAIESVLTAVDRRQPSELTVPAGGSTLDGKLVRVRSLRDLLGAVRRRLVEQRVLGGLDPRVPDLHEDSPRIGYGMFAEVVHPGPRFSAEDERLGRGRAGEAVPGLAEVFLALGRHALFGWAVGQGGPDGAVLRLVHVEEREGSHLGRPFRGTVFWCDGADVPPRFGRRGASISGAALHEGYWIDVDRVRLEQNHWLRLARRFHGDPARVRAALDVAGPRVSPAERATIDPTLGAGDRMRLAWMVEHGSTEAPAPAPLAALVEVVCVHEEGHLCDRATWYPLRSHLGALIGFAAAHGFSPGRIAEALEERAQLVALCCLPDPRFAWIDLLDSAERTPAGGRSPTPHAAGYRRLLGRLLERMSRELDRGEWPELDGERRLVDQLHRVRPERLTQLALREAHARGLAR